MSLDRWTIIVTALAFATLSDGAQIRFNSRNANEGLPGLLVIASDHGEGSSALGHALGSHPCFINVGEPFGSTEMWYSETGEHALFAKDGKRGQQETFSKLQSQLNDFLSRHGSPKIHLDPKLHLKTKTLEKFFQSVQKEACAHFELNRSCQGRCIVVHKMFPNYVSYDFSLVRDYLLSSETMVVQTLRDETAVIQSNDRRFNGMTQKAIDGLRNWTMFLDAKRKNVDGKKVWEIFKSSDDVFSSPFAYFEAVKGLFNKLSFDFADESSMLEIMQSGIEKQFASYNRAKEKYLKRHHTTPHLMAGTTKANFIWRLMD